MHHASPRHRCLPPPASPAGSAAAPGAGRAPEDRGQEGRRWWPRAGEGKGRRDEAPDSGVQGVRGGGREVPGLPGQAADHRHAGLAQRHPSPATGQEQDSGMHDLSTREPHARIIKAAADETSENSQCYSCWANLLIP